MKRRVPNERDEMTTGLAGEPSAVESPETGVRSEPGVPPGVPPGADDGPPGGADGSPGGTGGPPAPGHAPSGRGVPGPAEREFVRFAYRYAYRIRLVVVCSCAVLAVPAMPVDSMAATSAVSAVVLVWSALHYRLGMAGIRPRLILATDLAVLIGLCLTQTLTIPDTQTMYGSTWLLVVVSIVAVGYQLMYPPALAVALALLLAVADLAGVVLDRPDGWDYALPNVSWLLVQTALSQGMYQLVLRASRTADAVGAETAAARRRHEVAQAQRSAEREHLATLHDTACATLLMVSAHGRSIHPHILRTQAGKDLRRLASERVTSGETDVAQELRAEIGDHLLSVRAEFDGSLGLMWRPAAVAIRGSLGEALRNVARHAGVDSATVTARREGDTITVTISDGGVGFDTAQVPPHCRGLARSVVERMAAVGGRATIDSGLRRGTAVRLEWPHV
ncbi:sensor histidine kinase [Streptomyces sp. NPDC088400]|uniref:sensor histidine kinase n=1 Tax=Streptomyces sp. NPDC088400 TaxID=3365861 RepID=UPI00381175D3